MATAVNWTPEMAQSAATDARAWAQRQRRSREIPQVIPTIRAMADSTAVHIFSVSPWRESVQLGSWGSYDIPALPKGKRYVHVATIPGVYTETQPGDGRFTLDQIDGMYVAQCIVGEGDMLSHVNPNESRARRGVFIGSVRGPGGIEPLPGEVDAAYAALEQNLYELIAEANTAHSAGGLEAAATISSRHRLAASIMNRTDLPWVREQAPEKQIRCGGCNKPMAPDTLKCGECGYLPDPAKYWTAVAEGRFVSQGQIPPAFKHLFEAKKA